MQIVFHIANKFPKMRETFPKTDVESKTRDLLLQWEAKDLTLSKVVQEKLGIWRKS